MRIDVANAEGWRFGCLAGCGFCCVTSPSVLPSDEPRARAGGLPIVERLDGTLGLRVNGVACAMLDSARGCRGYDARPFACRAFPVQLHVLDRLQADLHLGCPGLATGGVGEDARAMAQRIAEEAIAAGALDLETARANAAMLRDRLAAMGFPEPGPEVAESFAGIDATAPDTLRALYAAASDPALEPDDVAEAVEAGRAVKGVSLAKLLAEVAAETPRRAPDHPEAASLGWRDLDLSQVPAAAALALSPAARAPLAAHAARLLRRDLTWGHALRVVDATGYEVSPAAAYARVLADAGAGLLLRAHATGGAAEAVASYEWHYWGLPSVGSGL